MCHDHSPSGGPRTVERHCDVAVIGGSAAGLAAALQLARQRLGVIVVDAGEPRNAPAAAMHGYLGHETLPPAELTRLGREEVRRHGVEVLDGRVVDVTAPHGTPGGFALALTGGHTVVARRVLVATGLVDVLPDIDGVAVAWGRDVVHCPFCHGYELRDGRIVQVVTQPAGLHAAVLFARLAGSMTVVLDLEGSDGPDDDAEPLPVLRAGGVEVRRGHAVRVATDADGAVRGVELADGTVLDADAVAVTPAFEVRTRALDGLGVHTVAHPSGLGRVLQVGDDGQTSVPGVYGAGNVVDPSHQVLHAAADGSRVAARVAVDLATEDLADAGAAPANQADWDHRYGGERMWSGNPNGSLVDRASQLAPGRALDVGAGEGGDAIWLAEHGWTVTAADISERALERVAAEATRRGLAVESLHADANAATPFPQAAFDLVSAQYASIPRTPDGRGIANMVDAVAPGGTLLVVGHDLAPMRTPVDTATDSRAFDPDAYVRVDDVAAAVAGSPDWEVLEHATVPRPPGAVSTHHVDDVVLVARRAPA